jgi:hypothetical protein
LTSIAPLGYPAIMSITRTILCALLASACSTTHTTDDVGTGIYDLTIDAEVDQCSPTRISGAMGAVAVITNGRVIDAPVPEITAAPLTAPRVRLVPDNDFHAETNVRVPGCGNAWVHEEWTLMEGHSASFELLHMQRWNGMADCPNAQEIMPAAPSGDCMAERHLRYRLQESCASPCSLGLAIDAPSGAACVCPSAP